MRLPSLAAALVAAVGTSTAKSSPDTASQCTPATFSSLDIPYVEISEIQANPVTNYTSRGLLPATANLVSGTIDICNVTVTYGHPGWNDTINVSVWLPLNSWNGRLLAIGGGGFAASFGDYYMFPAAAKDFVALASDAGHPSDLTSSVSPAWVLTATGNLNLPLIEDWASRALGEMTAIGKQVTKALYSTPASYSYFLGCSGGGRQAMTIAQQFPEDYEGILAAAPAIHMGSFVAAAFWARQTMNDLGIYPSPCESDAFTEAAVDACDTLDGLKDGIISTPSLCNFSAHSVVRTPYTCNGTQYNFTATAATVVQAAWDGVRSPEGDFSSPGLNVGASLSTAVIETECASNGTCSPTTGSSDVMSPFFKYMLAKDPDFDVDSMSDEQFFDYHRLARRQYFMLEDADPYLTALKKTVENSSHGKGWLTRSSLPSWSWATSTKS
jgi:hypothetical protein